jgi:drug/metabolite transporter (DMT)-like permease
MTRQTVLRALKGTTGGHLAMLSFSALIAGSFSLGAMAAPFVDPAALTTFRFLLAGLLLASRPMPQVVCVAMPLQHPGATAFWEAYWRFTSC